MTENQTQFKKIPIPAEFKKFVDATIDFYSDTPHSIRFVFCELGYRLRSSAASVSLRAGAAGSPLSLAVLPGARTRRRGDGGRAGAAHRALLPSRSDRA